MNTVPKHILNIWNELKNIILQKKDFYYIDHFFKNCNPVFFQNGKLEFEVSSTNIFKKLKEDGVFKMLIKKAPEIISFTTSINKIKNLVVGKFNESFIEVSEQILKKNFIFNPIFVHSEPGLGKTFILKKILEASKKSEISMKYYHMNDFVKDIYEFFNKNETKKLEEFKNNLTNKYEVILFDDIQFLSGKEKTSEIFFQIINNKNINLIFAADVHPEELISINKRIISRLQKGIIIKMDIPDINTGIKIVEFFFKNFNFSLKKIEKAAIESISKNFRQDIRKTEGIVKKIIFNFSTKKEIIKIADLDFLLNNYKFSLEKKTTSQKIIKTVAFFYGLSSNQLISKQRSKGTIIAKYMSMFLIREIRNDTYEIIAKTFRAKNHTTAVNGIKKFRKLLKIDNNLKQELKEIKKRCIDF